MDLVKWRPIDWMDLVNWRPTDWMDLVNWRPTEWMDLVNWRPIEWKEVILELEVALNPDGGWSSIKYAYTRFNGKVTYLYPFSSYREFHRSFSFCRSMQVLYRRLYENHFGILYISPPSTNQRNDRSLVHYKMFLYLKFSIDDTTANWNNEQFTSYLDPRIVSTKVLAVCNSTSRRLPKMVFQPVTAVIPGSYRRVIVIVSIK
jgi:hypothetical protein